MIAIASTRAWVHSLARKLEMTVGKPMKKMTTSPTNQ